MSNTAPQRTNGDGHREDERGDRQEGEETQNPNDVKGEGGVPDGKTDPADGRNGNIAEDFLNKHAGDAGQHAGPPSGGSLSDQEITDQFGGGASTGEPNVDDLLNPNIGADPAFGDYLEPNGGPPTSWDDVDAGPGGVQPNVEVGNDSPLTQEEYDEGYGRLADLAIALEDEAKKDGEMTPDEHASVQEAVTALDNFAKKHDPESVWVLERGGDHKSNFKDGDVAGEKAVDFVTNSIKGEEVFRNYATGDLSDRENLPDDAHTTDGRSTIDGQKGLGGTGQKSDKGALDIIKEAWDFKHGDSASSEQETGGDDGPGEDAPSNDGVDDRHYGDPTGEENAATAEWLRGQGLGETVTKTDPKTDGTIDPGSGETDVDTGGGSGVDNDDGVTNPGGADGGSGPKGGGKTPGAGRANEPDYGPDDNRTYEGRERSPGDEVVGVSHGTGLDGDLTDGELTLDPEDLGAPSVVGLPSDESGTDEESGDDDEPVEGDVEERTKSGPQRLDDDTEHLVEGEAELESIVADGDESGDDFLSEQADDVARRGSGDNGDAGAGSGSGPTNNQISDEFGDDGYADPGLGRDAEAEDDHAEDLLTPDVPSSGDGSEWEQGAKGWDDGPGGDSSLESSGPSMGDIASGHTGDRAWDRNKAISEYERSDKTPDDYQDLQAELADIDAETPVQTGLAGWLDADQETPMPDPPPAKPPAEPPASPVDQSGINEHITTAGGDYLTKGEAGGLDRNDEQTAAPGSAPGAVIVDDDSQMSKETVTVVDDTGESSEVPVNHQSSNDFSRLTYGYDEDGQYWATDENNNSWEIERDEIPEGRHVEDLDNVFGEEKQTDTTPEKETDDTDDNRTENETKDQASEADKKEDKTDDAGQPDPENYEDEETLRAREQREHIERQAGADTDEGLDAFDRPTGIGNDVDPVEHNAVDTTGGSGTDNNQGVTNPGGADGGSGPQGSGKSPGPGDRNEPDYGPDDGRTYEGRERSPGDEVVGVSHSTGLDGDLTEDAPPTLDPDSIAQGPPEVIETQMTGEDAVEVSAEPAPPAKGGGAHDSPKQKEAEEPKDELDPKQEKVDEEKKVDQSEADPHQLDDGGKPEVAIAPPVKPPAATATVDPADTVDESDFVWTEESKPKDDEVAEASKVDVDQIDTDYGKPTADPVADHSPPEEPEDHLAEVAMPTPHKEVEAPQPEPEPFPEIVEVAKDNDHVDEEVEELLTD